MNESNNELGSKIRGIGRDIKSVAKEAAFQAGVAAQATTGILGARARWHLSKDFNEAHPSGPSRDPATEAVTGAIMNVALPATTLNELRLETGDGGTQSRLTWAVIDMAGNAAALGAAAAAHLNPDLVGGLDPITAGLATKGIANGVSVISNMGFEQARNMIQAARSHL